MYATLKEIKAMGYDGVEFAGLYGNAPERIREMCEEIGLVPISAHVPYLDMVADAEGVLSAYASIGCKYVVVPYLTEEYRPGTPKFSEVIENVKVIGGSLYRVIPNGLELITYAGAGKNATVADGTARISAWAFAGSDVKSVSLPKEVASIGHKAFFKCESLTLVTFQSYNAPILEEEFDYNYFASYENIPATGDYTFMDGNGKEIIFSGLGIVDCFMWNADSSPYVVYYGANFIDYIGHIENPITMVCPANGKNYDSFILSNYFDNVLLGAAAADDITLAAIELIEKLPETVSLDDKAAVETARAAYDAISTLEQRSLVTNYQKLTEAEARIEKLLTLENGTETEPPAVTDPEDKNDPTETILIVLTTLLVFTILALIFKDSITGKNATKTEEGEKKDNNENN
jgi:hypothetical protein